MTDSPRYISGRGLLRRPRCDKRDMTEIGFWSAALRKHVPWEQVKADLMVPFYRRYDTAPPSLRKVMRGE